MNEGVYIAICRNKVNNVDIHFVISCTKRLSVLSVVFAVNKSVKSSENSPDATHPSPKISTTEEN